MAKKMGDSLGESLGNDAKWKADQDAQDTQQHVKTLHSAFDILQDPMKMKKVHKLAGRHHKAIKSLGDLKLARDAFNAPKDDGDGDNDNMSAAMSGI